MRVLFLDIDGVLNSDAYFLAKTDRAAAAVLDMQFKLGTAPVPDREEHARRMIDPAAVEHLNVILDRAGPHGRIVISSSWRNAYTLGEIGRALGANGFRHRRAIIDKTRSLGTPRGIEIHDWLSQRTNVETFAILDDGDDMGVHKNRLVQGQLRPRSARRVLARDSLLPDAIGSRGIRRVNRAETEDDND